MKQLKYLFERLWCYARGKHWWVIKPCAKELSGSRMSDDQWRCLYCNTFGGWWRRWHPRELTVSKERPEDFYKYDPKKDGWT